MNYNNRNNSSNHTGNKKPVSFRRYRRRIMMDPGIIIFLLLAIYILVCIILYALKPHVSVYEVPFGGISKNYDYSGIVIRTEQIIPSDRSGYITYYSNEGTKVGVRSTICSIDETGQVSSMLRNQTGGNQSLSSEDLAGIKAIISAFRTNYHNMHFSEAYSYKQEIEGTTVEIINNKLLSRLAGSDELSGLFNIYKSSLDGVISYNIDGYEGLTMDGVTDELMNKSSSYKKNIIRQEEIINVSEPIYKLITEDEWSVVIETDAETAKRMKDKGYMNITFKKDNSTAWGKVSTWEKEGKNFVGLTFNNSMIRFSSDRYLQLEFKLDNIEGLKIPNSALIDKTFFTIPVDYLTYGGDDNSQGVYLEKFNEDGSTTQQFAKLTIYNKTDSLVYVNMDDFHSGDNIIKPESQDRYTFGKTEKLTGVYNINKGYSLFMPVTILSKSKEYSIIEPNTDYGLSKYDYIILDAASVPDNFMY